MRTWVVIGVILALLSFGVIWSNHSLNSTSEALVKDIEAIEKAIEGLDWERAERLVKRVEKDWDANKDIWTVLVTHREIDDIDLTLHHLKQSIKSEELAFTRCDLATLRFLIVQTVDSQSFILRNIF